LLSENAEARVDRLAGQCLHEALPFAAVLIAEAPGGARALPVERLPRSEALLELLRRPRAIGWNQPKPLRTHFAKAGVLAAAVPVSHPHTARLDRMDSGVLHRGCNLLTQRLTRGLCFTREAVPGHE
jgi:hypothetical protein